EIHREYLAALHPSGAQPPSLRGERDRLLLKTTCRYPVCTSGTDTLIGYVSLQANHPVCGAPRHHQSSDCWATGKVFHIHGNRYSGRRTCETATGRTHY